MTDVVENIQNAAFRVYWFALTTVIFVHYWNLRQFLWYLFHQINYAW